MGDIIHPTRSRKQAETDAHLAREGKPSRGASNERIIMD